MAKNRNRTLLLVFSLAIAVLVGLLLWQKSKRTKGEPVDMEQVNRRTIQETVEASGKIFPQSEVKISSVVSGEIVDLYVEEGDSVVQGQLLVRIDPEAIESQVERGIANVNSAKAQLANSRSQIENAIAQKEQIEAQLISTREIHKRNIQLRKEGVIAQADFETSQANLDALEANLRASDAAIKAAKESAQSAEYQLRSSEATLKELRVNLDRTTIYAPVGGIISQLNVEKGERVVGTIQMAGTEMMRIANLNAMEVRVEVSENDIPKVALGDQVSIEVDAYLDRAFKGSVYQIGNSAISTTLETSLTSDQVTNFEVRITVDPASYADLISPSNPYPLRPGMSATVEITTEVLDDALSVPIQAVTTRENEEKDESGFTDDDLMEVVFVVEDDTVTMARVTTGIQDDRYIQVTSGLSEGQTIVTGPYNTVSRKLSQGDAVSKKEEKAERGSRSK